MESTSNYKDRDRKYVLIRVPESCFKLGWTTGCQPRFLFFRCYLRVQPYL